MPERTQEELNTFLETAFERFKTSEAAESEWRRDALDDVKFYAGNQWEETARRRRRKNKQPILTINRLPQFKRQITNEIRQQRPAVQVNPRHDTTVEGAQIVQGRIRDIEVDSHADMVYDLGTDQMVITGLGYWRINTAYKSGMTFDQKIRIKPIKNHFMVYDDPDCEELDRSDRQYLFIVCDLSTPEFKRKYPQSKTAASLSDLQSVGDNPRQWLKDGGVRLAEYYYTVEKTVKLYEYKDGRVTLDAPPDKNDIEQERDVSKTQVMWSKICALDVLEEHEVPCAFIPVVVVVGEEINIDGKVNWTGMVRDGKDAQRAYNYWKTSATSQIALASKDPVIAASGQLQNHEEEWRDAHLNDPAVLTYEPVVEGNQLLPAPAKQPSEPPIQAMSAMMNGAANDLMATIGLNDASLGERRPDEAARSVLLRQQQGKISTAHYSDNVSRAVRFTGELILSYMQCMDEAPHVGRIIKADDSVSHAVFHKNQPDQAKKLAKDGQQVVDLGQGTYDVTVSVGPSYQTKRQEAVASILALIQAEPSVLNIVGDLLFGNMDWHNAPEIAKRFKKLLPPQLQETDASGDPAQQLAQTQAAFFQLQQQHKQLIDALKQANQIITTKMIEANSRERVAAINAAAGVEEAALKAHAEGTLATLNAELDALQARFQMSLGAPPEGGAQPSAGGQGGQ